MMPNQTAGRDGMVIRWLAVVLATLVAMTAPAMAQDGYRLKRGDVLRIEVLEDTNLNQVLTVAPDGRVTLPLIGSVQAGGRTVPQVQADVASKLAPNFAAPPSVFVALERVNDPYGVEGKAASLISIYVMGEAARPGLIEVAPRTTVLQAMSQMGGFTKFAAKKRIQLRRGGKVYPLNYVAIERGTSTAGYTQLQAGDVIVIPQRRLFE